MQHLPIDLQETILSHYADTATTKKVLRQVCRYFRYGLPLNCAYSIMTGLIAWAISEFISSDADFFQVNDVIILTDNADDLKEIIRDAMESGEKFTIEFNVSHDNVCEFFASSNRCKAVFLRAAYIIGQLFPGSSLSQCPYIYDPIILKTGFDFERCVEINVVDSKPLGVHWLDEFVFKFE